MKESLKNLKTNHIRWNGATHLILLITKFYGKDIGIQELREINPVKLKRPLSDFRRELLRLELLGFIKFINKDKTRWTITNSGFEFVYTLARKCSKTTPDSFHDGA